MRVAILVSSLAVAVTAQGVTQYIAPKGGAPSGCAPTKDGKYELSVEPLGKKVKRNMMSAVRTIRFRFHDVVVNICASSNKCSKSP